MSIEIINDTGRIIISREVIAKLAGIAATECFGVVGMVSSRIFRDGLEEVLGREAISKGVDVEDKDGKINIKVNIVVTYGAKVSVIAGNVMERVKYAVENYTGLTVNHIEVNVQGVRVVD